jgi:hypothetical protein
MCFVDNSLQVKAAASASAAHLLKPPPEMMHTSATSITAMTEPKVEPGMPGCATVPSLTEWQATHMPELLSPFVDLSVHGVSRLN